MRKYLEPPQLNLTNAWILSIAVPFCGHHHQSKLAILRGNSLKILRIVVLKQIKLKMKVKQRLQCYGKMKHRNRDILPTRLE